MDSDFRSRAARIGARHKAVERAVQSNEDQVVAGSGAWMVGVVFGTVAQVAAEATGRADISQMVYVSVAEVTAPLLAGWSPQAVFYGGGAALVAVLHVLRLRILSSFIFGLLIGVGILSFAVVLFIQHAAD